jgi:hypothetical protein
MNYDYVGWSYLCFGNQLCLFILFCKLCITVFKLNCIHVYLYKYVDSTLKKLNFEILPVAHLIHYQWRTNSRGAQVWCATGSLFLVVLASRLEGGAQYDRSAKIIGEGYIERRGMEEIL